MRIGRFVDQAQPVRPEGVNICGVLVHARPDLLGQVRAALTALPGVEIHQSSADGRLVVTVEDADGEWAGATITRFHEIPGVLSAALVYHHCDDCDDAEETTP